MKPVNKNQTFENFSVNDGNASIHDVKSTRIVRQICVKA